MLESKEQADVIIKKMCELEKNSINNMEHDARSLRKGLSDSIDKLDESLTERLVIKKSGNVNKEEVKLGDTVLITNLNQKGTVLSLPDKNNELLVQVGIMKINAHLSNISVVDEQKQTIEKLQRVKVTGIKTKTIKLELDIRGHNIEEAILEIDKYLDEVAIAGIGEVTIIHGKGTGVLRAGVREYLKTHSHVSEFRSGKYREGEDGVTIVKIN